MSRGCLHDLCYVHRSRRCSLTLPVSVWLLSLLSLVKEILIGELKINLFPLREILTNELLQADTLQSAALANRWIGLTE